MVGIISSAMNSSLFINRNALGKFTVEPEHSSLAWFTGNTQEEAINWAKKSHPNSPLHVARDRHLSDKRIPDHWRKL